MMLTLPVFGLLNKQTGIPIYTVALCNVCSSFRLHVFSRIGILNKQTCISSPIQLTLYLDLVTLFYDCLDENYECHCHNFFT